MWLTPSPLSPWMLLPLWQVPRPQRDRSSLWRTTTRRVGLFFCFSTDMRYSWQSWLIKMLHCSVWRNKVGPSFPPLFFFFHPCIIIRVVTTPSWTSCVRGSGFVEWHGAAVIVIFITLCKWCYDAILCEQRVPSHSDVVRIVNGLCNRRDLH